MPIAKVTIEAFLELASEFPILDVRSPGEYEHAHIPGAHSLPLFTNEERKVVGTAYKQESREKAIKLGLAFFGPKMVAMVEEAEALLNPTGKAKTATKPKTVLVHCWRGGMRSAGVAWMLDLYGFKVYTLVGGYKTYRNWVLKQFEKTYPLHIVGGYTGSGKTELLLQLQQKKESVIDLEGLACHKGSAFGKLGQPESPSQEMFENKLAVALVNANQYCAEREAKDKPGVIWLEDESQRIGDVNIPTPFFAQMRMRKLFFIQIPFEERLSFILQHYGGFEKEKLMNAIIRIQKRLGGLETKTAMNCLLNNDLRACFAILLHYYDKQYLKGLQKRDNFSELLHKLDLDTVATEENAELLLAYYLEGAGV